MVGWLETHESALYIHDWDTGIDIGCRSQGKGDIILISVEVGICRYSYIGIGTAREM